jgi:hypothetical protein
MSRSRLQQRLETAFAGLIYITLGTVLATQVKAQSSHAKASASKTAKAPSRIAAPAKLSAPPACETNQAPDAMCTLPLKQGPELKICFSIKHSRCFELKDGHLVQTLTGQVAQDTTLTAAQAANVKTSIDGYREWLDQQLSKQPKSVTLCRDVVSVDSKSEHKEYCLSKLPKKQVQAKTKDLFASLENASGVKSSRSSAP